MNDIFVNDTIKTRMIPSSLYCIIENTNYDPSNPDNIRLYHGTTHIGKEDILIHGFHPIEDSIWDCSLMENVYCYELNRLAEVEDYEDDSLHNKQWLAISRANESAQIQEAILDNPGEFTYVLEIVLPPEFKGLIEEDNSCEDMANYGAIQIDADVLNVIMSMNKCTINVYHAYFYPKLSYAYICGLVDNPYCASYMQKLPSNEKVVLKVFQQAVEVLYDDIICCECEYKECFGPDDINRYSC